MIVNKKNFIIDIFHQTQIIDGKFKSKGIERKRHLLQVLPQALIPGYVLEFGVYRGKTMQHISEFFPDQTCWGFDSFIGLPEPWHISSGSQEKTHPAGKFDMRKEDSQPVFKDNVKLVKGWFQDSLPQWLSENPGPVKFLHIDCDLYSSTKTVLTFLNERIVPGTVIVFDEMYPWADIEDYNLWQTGEYQALDEWLQEFDRSFVPLFRSRHQQCSIRIQQ